MKMKKNILGVDIGGTKCAVIYGQKEGDTLHLVEKVKFPTMSVDETIANICSEIEQMMAGTASTRRTRARLRSVAAGRSTASEAWSCRRLTCPGGTIFRSSGCSKNVSGSGRESHNDANACALAEWKFGAGVGTQKMVFLTFGTGLGQPG